MSTGVGTYGWTLDPLALAVYVRILNSSIKINSTIKFFLW